MLKTKLNVSRRAAGFTLLEVLVAIAVFSMLSLSAYQVLNGVQRSNAQSLEHNARLQEIQRAMVMMDNDFRQIVARKTRNLGETASDKLLQSSEYLLDSSSDGILFTRLGWQNPQEMFPRGEVLKVGYRVVDDTLERVWFRYPDTVVGTDALVRPILTGVEKLAFRFYSDKKWSDRWDKAATLPQGVMVQLTLEDYGEIERVYMLPTSVLTAEKEE
ncbi:type II secretion system protein GspJ [Photobacterium aphoticum]|uniref:Type II secretion system protein J n=1 Tax=Photobacterium aphoticum TaxID=754436 RepID=A0A0J1GPH2_9GAMM|nr:general secretion pathway protein GspJ [Photobacterium aphoticum]PSU54949.1 type II secretion system protein GspJ [Photobacterium aphoticum]GHA61584.1 type II secretion system protein GspJ [Photobacterium aphoticum]